MESYRFSWLPDGVGPPGRGLRASKETLSHMGGTRGDPRDAPGPAAAAFFARSARRAGDRLELAALSWVRREVACESENDGSYRRDSPTE